MRHIYIDTRSKNIFKKRGRKREVEKTTKHPHQPTNQLIDKKRNNTRTKVVTLTHTHNASYGTSCLCFAALSFPLLCVLSMFIGCCEGEEGVYGV